MSSQTDVPAPSLFTRLLARPAYAVLALGALQCVGWTLSCALTHHAPPLDMVESYLWGHEWVVGTHKHPNLPGWLLEISRQMTGAIGWPGYLVSELLVAASYGFVFLLGRDMLGAPRALAGTLLLAALFYNTFPSIQLNHNIAQMPFWAGIAWLVWHLRTRPSALGWVLLGVIGAGSLYAKLSSALLIGVAGLWILYDPLLRRQLATPWPWLGLASFAVLLWPLTLWLIQFQFAPLNYAVEQAEASDGPLQFLGSQIGAVAGVVVLAAYAGFLGTRHRPGIGPGPVASGPAPPPVLRYLAVFTLAPLLLTIGWAWFSGTGLRGNWGTPMLGLSGLWIVAARSPRFSPVVLGRLARAVLVLLIALPVAHGLDTLFEARLGGRIKRQNWPQAEMKQRFDQLWQARTGGKPLRVIAGERWLAGLVALGPGEMPSVLTNGDYAITPWVTPERVAKEGALVVWITHEPPDPVPGDVAPLVGSRPSGVERFTWPLFPGASPLLIGYAIVPPA